MNEKWTRIIAAIAHNSPVNSHNQSNEFVSCLTHTRWRVGIDVDCTDSNFIIEHNSGSSNYNRYNALKSLCYSNPDTFLFSWVCARIVLSHHAHCVCFPVCVHSLQSSLLFTSSFSIFNTTQAMRIRYNRECDEFIYDERLNNSYTQINRDMGNVQIVNGKRYRKKSVREWIKASEMCVCVFVREHAILVQTATIEAIRRSNYWHRRHIHKYKIKKPCTKFQFDWKRIQCSLTQSDCDFFTCVGYCAVSLHSLHVKNSLFLFKQEQQQSKHTSRYALCYMNALLTRLSLLLCHS